MKHSDIFSLYYPILQMHANARECSYSAHCIPPLWLRTLDPPLLNTTHIKMFDKYALIFKVTNGGPFCCRFEVETSPLQLLMITEIFIEEEFCQLHNTILCSLAITTGTWWYVCLDRSHIVTNHKVVTSVLNDGESTIENKCIWTSIRQWRPLLGFAEIILHRGQDTELSGGTKDKTC